VSRKHVLVVEDDTVFREALVDLLGNLGHGAVGVDDGVDALLDLSRARPDLILLDLIMPKAALDGLGVLSRLAAGPAANVPIVVISGLGEPLVERLSPQAASTLRIAAVLAKPVQIETLVREIERFLGPGVR
jgi:CheY-like chemotaxis protein